MFGFIQKILLSALTLGVSAAFFVLTYKIFVEEHSEFNFDNTLPILVTIFGVLSFVFHLKTIRFYKKKSLKVLNYSKNKPLWIMNLGFIAVLIFLLVFFVYSIVKVYNSSIDMTGVNVWVYVIIVLLPTLLITWLFFDMRFLYKKKNELEEKAAIDVIDDIAGTSESEAGKIRD